MSSIPHARFSARGIQEHEDARRPSPAINVGEAERWASAIGGGALVALGVRRGSFGGLALAALGGGLLYRAVTGHCHGYAAMGIDTTGKGEGDARAADGVHRGTLTIHAQTIHRPAADLYAFWRDEANAPKFMEGIASATKTGPKSSHWVAEGPMGLRPEWDAEIIADDPGRMFAWKTLPGAPVPHAGTVRFDEAKAGTGETVVTLELNYEAPGGLLGRAAAKVVGMSPESLSRENLRRFKQLMEAGELATTAGQPSGRA